MTPPVSWPSSSVWDAAAKRSPATCWPTGGGWSRSTTPPAWRRRAAGRRAWGCCWSSAPTTTPCGAWWRTPTWSPPAPACRVRHPVFSGRGRSASPCWARSSSAWRDLDRPVVAVTGTNGKTTVTTLVARMLVESGVAAIAAGNIGLPLTSAVGRGRRGGRGGGVVVPTAVRRRRSARRWRVWLNLAPDHLDWHPDVDAYMAAKARIWERQSPDDVAVVNADDPVVMAAAAARPGPGRHLRPRSAGDGGGAPDWTVVDGMLRGPTGAAAGGRRAAPGPAPRPGQRPGRGGGGLGRRRHRGRRCGRR